MKAALPANEAARLESLRRYAVLDTLPEESFDDLTLVAAQICQVPLAMISFVGHDRQWFKSKRGLSTAETPRDISFCAHTILQHDELMVVSDAHADPRFADNPLVVGDPEIRFYAGAPLVTSAGHALGALCVMDRRPRRLTAKQRAALQALSRRVVVQLELRRQTIEIQDKEREMGRLLVIAEQSRRALLSVLEDEKLATRNLRMSEQRFREIADNIQEVFWITSPAKDEVIYISPAYERIWGRTCLSLLENPRSWFSAIHPDDRDQVIQAATIKQGRGDYDETYRVTHPNGAVRWIRDRAFPVRSPSGQVLRIVGTAEDITERRDLEEQFRQAHKMEAIGTLAGGIAHDFNNILAAIIGYAELARARVASDPLADKYLAAVQAGGARAAALVRQILAFSRQEDQRLERIELRQAVAEPLKLLRATLPATIAFDLELAADLPAILADATQIHQIVMNLCTNAGQAMGDRLGRLGLRLESVAAHALPEGVKHSLPPGAYVRLSVSDTGCGMSPEVIARIFEPFFTTKPIGEGTGLGLAVVHGIMQSYGGAITVTSQPGEGTTFYLYFPALAAGAVEKAEARDDLITGSGERILFVDDEKPLALLGQSMLRELGYHAECQTSAAAALEQWRANPDAFDLVITDLTMPGMLGTDLAERLLLVRPGQRIIITSGRADLVASDRLRALGIPVFLPKPYTFHSLGAAVHRALTRQPG